MAKSDDTKTAMVQPMAPAPAAFPSNIPKVEGKSNLPQVSDGTPKDEDYSGSYTKIDDGEEYALAVVADAAMNRTHFAKNSVHSWNGTKEEFRTQFDVKDSDKRAPKDKDADK
jgi:hypothetical protein